MSKGTGPLLYGTTALARYDCPKCGPNTLFRYQVCIHCGHKAEGAVIPERAQLSAYYRARMARKVNPASPWRLPSAATEAAAAIAEARRVKSDQGSSTAGAPKRRGRPPGSTGTAFRR